MMAWQQITVTVFENAVTGLTDFFNALGALSITYMDAEDHPVYEPGPGETVIWKHTKVIALYPQDTDLELIKLLSGKRFTELPFSDWQLETIADQDWERSWLEYYQPMKFADRLWVCPTGQEPQEANTVTLILDPGLAFGTGTHPTTALCLEWLASEALAGKNIIDFGCGSGILGIAAVLLGAAKADAIDIDPQALTATLNNANKNNVAKSIKTWPAESFPGQQADVLLANILVNPLIELAPLLAQYVKPGGSLILSGILTEQAQSITDCYKAWFKMLPPVNEKDWCLLEGKKR